jgi:hypothetical protein
MAKPAYKAVFVSPHLDDAVFSCGGEIARLVQEGPVLVLNLFTRYPEAMKSRAIVLGPERYQEEQAAADFLGFTSYNLDELDAPFRRPAYRSPGNLFAPPVMEDSSYLLGLRERVFAYLDGLDYEFLYIPLGIGWHVDHVLTHLVFEPWACQDNLFLYEDVPYALIPHASRYRLNELGKVSAARNVPSLASTWELKAWWQAAMAYADTALMRNLQPWLLRWFAIPVVSFYLYRLMALHRRRFHQAPGHTLVPLIRPISEQFDRKLEAMTLYRSQFREFFLERGDCLSALKAYAQSIDPDAGPLERYWKAELTI